MQKKKDVGIVNTVFGIQATKIRTKHKWKILAQIRTLDQVSYLLLLSSFSGIFTKVPVFNCLHKNFWLAYYHPSSYNVKKMTFKIFQ